MGNEGRAWRAVVRAGASIVSVVALLASCSSSGGGGGAPVSASIGPSGGTVQASDGSSLTIPPGALTSTTTITMTPVGAAQLPPPNPGSSVGVLPSSGATAYQFSPEGLQFSLPATITLVVQASAGDPSQLTLFTAAVNSGNKGYALATNEDDATHLSAEIMHFSVIWPAPGPTAFVAANHASSSPSNRSVTTGCQAGAGGAVCVSFNGDGECPGTCQCADGSACPGGNQSNCCLCAEDGHACPFNNPKLCGVCCGAASAPTCSATSSPQPILGAAPTNAGICFAGEPTCAGMQCAQGSTVCGTAPTCTIPPGTCTITDQYCCPSGYSTCCGSGVCAPNQASCVAPPPPVGVDGGSGDWCCGIGTDSTTGCSGAAMANDECTCLTSNGLACSTVFPSTPSANLVSSCGSTFACCFTISSGSCECITQGDVDSCYGQGASCDTVATDNGGTAVKSCPQ